MEEIEKKEDSVVSDDDLQAVSGGEVIRLDKPCPLCGQQTLLRSGREIVCKRVSCTFRVRL